MARTKLVDGVRVPLTPEEEAARDAEEAAWAANSSIRLARNTFEAEIKSAVGSAPFDPDERDILFEAYDEVKRFRLGVAAGIPVNDIPSPMIDAFQAVFTGQTKQQIATTIENRVEGFLVNGATALANKIKDGG